MRWNALFSGSPAIAALLLTAASARADWLDVRGLRDDFGKAICSPVDTGPPRDQPLVGRCRYGDATYIPYYSPLTPISVRWRTCKHWRDVYTHYYPGYLPRGQRGPNLFVSGGDPIAGPAWACPSGASAMGAPSSCGVAVGDYGVYSGAPRDEATLLHLGGGGYAGPSTYPRQPDIIDMLHR